MTKEYVFQGYDGLIYGDPLLRTPQQVGKHNKANHGQGVRGSWVPKDALTPKELANKASVGDLSGFESPCIMCGQFKRADAKA